MIARRRSTLDRAPVLMIVHSYYEEDPRVRREAESLVATGRPVHVISLRQPGALPSSELRGVAVHRIGVQRHQGAGLGVYLREYLSFGLRAAWRAWRLHREERFGVVQVHSLPDALAFAALPLTLAGVPLVLDLHEVMPELFRGRFPGASHRLVLWLLGAQERWSIALSTVTLSVNEVRRDRLVGLGIRPDKLAVVENTPSLARFDPAAAPVRPFRVDGSLRLVYAGGLTPTYELDVVIRALARLIADRPDLCPTLDLYGRGDSEPILRRLVDDLGLTDRVTFHGRIPLDAVPAAIAAADIGLAPTRRDDFTDLSLSTKVYEYAAMGKPVVATWLPMLARTFPGDAVASYPSGDDAALAAAIATVADDAAARSAAIERAAAITRAAAWEREALGYLAIVDRLAAPAEAGGRAGRGSLGSLGASSTGATSQATPSRR